MKVLVANVVFSEVNHSPLFSMWRFAIALVMFVGGTLYRHVHDYGWTTQEDWLPSLGAGTVLAGYSYFALMVFEVTALTEYLVADKASHARLTSREGEYLASITLGDMRQIYRYLGFSGDSAVLSGKHIVSQTGCLKTFMPETKWLFYTLLMCVGVYCMGSGIEDVGGVHEMKSPPETVYTNRASMPVGFLLAVYARLGKASMEQRLEKSYSVRSSFLINTGCVSLFENSVRVTPFESLRSDGIQTRPISVGECLSKCLGR